MVSKTRKTSLLEVNSTFPLVSHRCSLVFFFGHAEIQVGLQDFLVCIEMFIAAAVHKYTFGFETYMDGSFLILMEQRKGNLPTRVSKRKSKSVTGVPCTSLIAFWPNFVSGCRCRLLPRRAQTVFRTRKFPMAKSMRAFLMFYLTKNICMNSILLVPKRAVASPTMNSADGVVCRC